MSEIEILEDMETIEWKSAVKREMVEVDGQWILRLLFPDGTVKYVRNLAVPNELDPNDEEVWYWPAVEVARKMLHRIESDLLLNNIRLVQCTETAEIVDRPMGSSMERSCTGNSRIVIDILNPEMVEKYDKWKAERPGVEPTIVRGDEPA